MSDVFRIRKPEHALVDTALAGDLRRRYKNPNLFTVFNTRSKVWFLARWLIRDKGIAEELLDLGKGDAPRLQGRIYWAPPDASEGTSEADRIKRNAAAFEVAEREESEEFQRVQNWVQKRSGSPIPVIMG